MAAARSWGPQGGTSSCRGHPTLQGMGGWVTAREDLPSGSRCLNRDPCGASCQKTADLEKLHEKVEFQTWSVCRASCKN